MIIEGIENYIYINNQKVSDFKTKDKIDLGKIIQIHQAKDLQIIYRFDQDGDYYIELDIDQENNLDLVEIYEVSANATLHKKINIAENCLVTRYVENSETNQDFHIDEIVNVSSSSQVKCAYVEIGQNTTDSHITYNINGSQASVNTRLAALSSQSLKKHYQITLNHYAPFSYGQMDNYGIVKSKGQLIIDGVGRITKGQKGSSTHQTNKIIVFDSECHGQANPYLYIDEYDVKASHGASVGKIDENHLYYLQSRGLSKQEAMHLVTYGYFTPVIEYIHNDQLKERFNEILKTKVGL